MAFFITARTILHLGSELISSDAVALYELIKNAIDARSTSGVDVEFDIVIRQADFVAAFGLLEEDPEIDLEEAKAAFLLKVNSEADAELKQNFTSAICGARTKAALKRAASNSYRDCNRIVVRDTGTGMTFEELEKIYLTIGTTSRAQFVRKSLEAGEGAPPYLGEKGVGRLAVMRLGWKVHIETATSGDDETSILEIDWRKFEEADDADVSSVRIAPKPGRLKTAVSEADSFTRITVSDLRSSWSIGKLNQIGTEQIARMMDPFSWKGRRFQIRLQLNGRPVQPVRAVVGGLLQHAHGRCIGKYELKNGTPVLTARIESEFYEGDATDYTFDVVDLMSMSGLRESGQPSAILRRVGPFSFEFYWFNRQRLRAIPEVGDREVVRGLVKTWAGISLFRDGYRVLPYGDPGDDWLGLDHTALASSGYKLNTKQIIGRIRIGRISNPRLVDQTNRQGLIETPERDVLIELMRTLISNWWHAYLNEASSAQKKTLQLAFDSKEESSAVEELQARATLSIKEIRQNYTGEAQLLRAVKDAFTEIKEAHQRAVERILTIEEEKERLTQLAGVGLVVEVIAHELTRATELTQATLKELSGRSVSGDAASALRTLGQQIKVIQKRLQTLEPLSVAARFRRSRMRLSTIVS